MPGHSAYRTFPLSARSGTKQSPDCIGGGLTFQQLVLGGPFRLGGPGDEGAELATWLLAHHVDRGGDHIRLKDTLQKAVFLRAPGYFLAAAQDCREAARLQRPTSAVLEAAATLFVFFAAALGDREAARCVAAEAIGLAEADTTPESQTLELRAAALGWLSYAALEDAHGLKDSRQYARDAAERSMDGMARTWQRNLQKQSSEHAPTAGPEDLAAFDYLADDILDGVDLPGQVVVLKCIGGTETPEGGRVAKAFGGLVGNPLPLIRAPDLSATRDALLESYPHAGTVIDTVLSELVGRDYVRLPPILFVGSPGAGKTAFCASLLESLGLPGLLYSCGGVSDGALGGTSRRWQTGEPCTPVTVMSARQVASPGIVLDEIEKAGTSAGNGRIVDVLLGMLEPSSSSRWQDPYLQAEVDLSHVVWLATANSLEGLPKPLLDRCRILRMPVPGTEHLPVLSSMLLRRAYAARNLDERWARPLDGVELAAVAAAWRGGSIRRLARLLDGVLAARNHAPCLN